MTLAKFRPTHTPFNILIDNLFQDKIPFHTYPAVNVKEDDTAFYLELVVPGFQKEQLGLQVEQRLLTLTGKTSQTTESSAHPQFTRKEFDLTAFERKFTLPESIDVDRIAAGYNNGILQVYLPKLETIHNKQTRAIEIA